MVRRAEDLRPQHLAVTILGANGRSTARPVWSGGMVRLLGEFGFSTGAARVALGRLARGGLLERVKLGRHVYYTLTPPLVRLLAEGDRRIFGLGVADEWDGQWTVLWQAIPDRLGAERRRLVRRLRFLGFGSVQNGTWISPRDRAEEVATVLEQLGVEAHVGVIVGRPPDGTTIPALIAEAWDLDALAKTYERFLLEIRPYRSKRARERLSDREAFLARTRTVHRFRSFPLDDPGVPEDILHRRWKRREAVEAFHEVYDALADAAQRYFDARNAPPAAARP